MDKLNNYTIGIPLMKISAIICLFSRFIILNGNYTRKH